MSDFTDIIASIVFKDETCFPKYKFFPGFGYARDSPQANLKCGKIVQLCHESGTAVNSPVRRLFYGQNIIEAILAIDKHDDKSRRLNNSVKFAMRGVDEDNDRLTRKVPVIVRGVEVLGATKDESYGVETLRYRSKFNLDVHDQINMATVLRWSEQFLSFRWMKALMCRGTGDNVCLDSSDSEDKGYDGGRSDAPSDRQKARYSYNRDKWWEDDTSDDEHNNHVDDDEEFDTDMQNIRQNRKAIPGAEYSKRQCFDLARFQVLNKLETLAQNWKMMDMHKYAQILLVILKRRIDMDYLTFDECQTLYDRLVQYTVFVTLVQRRMGKTVSHIANACMECVMFPTAGHMNMYVTGDGRLTANAFNTMCTNIPDMLEEFNAREKLHFLHMTQQNPIRNSVQRKNKNSGDLTFTDFYLQGYTLKDSKRTAMAVCFKRYLIDGTCLDPKRPFSTNLFRCLIIVQKSVSIILVLRFYFVSSFLKYNTLRNVSIVYPA